VQQGTTIALLLWSKQEVSMMKLAFPLSLGALALLAACVSTEPVTPAPAPVVVQPAPAVVTAPPPGTVVVPQAATAPVVVPTPTAIRPGFGRIESITALPPSAAAGGTAKPMQRLGIKMDDGTVQYVDTGAQGVRLGDRVELTRDGHIRYPA
jgi:hypothetical protein